MKLIRLGINPYDNKDVYFMERESFGVNIVVAPTRYGKSAVVKILYQKIGNFTKRPIIIFDYRDEHKESNYPNWDSPDNILCLPLKTVENFGFMISDFINALDWQSLGFSKKTSMRMAELASCRNSHHDDPEIFSKMIYEAPQDVYSLKRFNNKWGTHLVRPIHSEVYKVMQMFETFQDIFCSQKSKLKYVGDWRTFIRRYKYVHVCLNAVSDIDLLRARAFVGKILEQCSDPRFLMYNKPVFIFEEADKLIPNLTSKEQDDGVPSSLEWIREYVLKLQKFHPEMFFITQDTRLIDDMIFSNYHTIIAGGNHPHIHRATAFLKWDASKNYREFLLLNKGNPKYEIFVPETIPCATTGL